MAKDRAAGPCDCAGLEQTEATLAAHATADVQNLRTIASLGWCSQICVHGALTSATPGACVVAAPDELAPQLPRFATLQLLMLFWMFAPQEQMDWPLPSSVHVLEGTE
jgi:hypothetical protein